MRSSLAIATPWSVRTGPNQTLVLTIGGAFGLAAVAAVVAPAWFWLPLITVAFAGLGVLAYRCVTSFCVLWLLLAGATLEMALGDIVGPGVYQTSIAAIKAAELVLALLCVLRFGLARDASNPALAFLAMYIAGLAHGLHPALTWEDSARSLIGSIAPFAFAFSRVPATWGRAIVRATAGIPLMSVAGGALLALAGLRPFILDIGGARLAGLGHPAFLAGFCLTAIYACLLELYRDGKPLWLGLLGANFVILILTGARAPFAYAVLVTATALLFVHSEAFPRRSRIAPILIAATLLLLLVAMADTLHIVRLVNILTGDATNLSGRELLWPEFERAAAGSPWFGWGVGAGNAIIPPDSELVRLIQSWAAHNEYLRMQVEGGQIGLALLIVLFVIWVVWHTRSLLRSDRIIMRLAFLAFAAHAYTDNVLIATTACVFFTFATAVFARGRRLMNAGEVA